jgi:hypothetical protein
MSYTVYIKDRRRSKIFDFVELVTIETLVFRTFEKALEAADHTYETMAGVDYVSITSPVGRYAALVLYVRERFPEEIESALSEHGEVDWIPSHTNYLPPYR